MKVASADPGPSRVGTATIEVTAAGKLLVIEGRHRPWSVESAADRTWWKARCREAFTSCDEGGIVAVEQVLHAYGDTPDGALIDTKDVEAAMVALAYEVRDDVGRGTVVRASAVSWRKDLGIQPPRTDDQVAIVVEWAYGKAALDHLDDKAREHVYDALGLAVVAVARTKRTRVTVPAHVAAAVYKAWQEAKANNKARKARKTAAEPVRKVIAAAGGAAVLIADIMRATGMSPDAVLAALKVISAARAPEAAQARAALVAAGVRKADKRPQTAPAKKRRSEAARRGKGWRRRGPW